MRTSRATHRRPFFGPGSQHPQLDVVFSSNGDAVVPDPLDPVEGSEEDVPGTVSRGA